ncbi:MAG: hypothetical protein QXS93_00190 [Candidatus Micrarchaeia archaeon]
MKNIKHKNPESIDIDRPRKSLFEKIKSATKKAAKYGLYGLMAVSIFMKPPVMAEENYKNLNIEQVRENPKNDNELIFFRGNNKEEYLLKIKIPEDIEMVKCYDYKGVPFNEQLIFLKKSQNQEVTSFICNTGTLLKILGKYAPSPNSYKASQFRYSMYTRYDEDQFDMLIKEECQSVENNNIVDKACFVKGPDKYFLALEKDRNSILKYILHVYKTENDIKNLCNKTIYGEDPLLYDGGNLQYSVGKDFHTFNISKCLNSDKTNVSAVNRTNKKEVSSINTKKIGIGEAYE